MVEAVLGGLLAAGVVLILACLGEVALIRMEGRRLVSAIGGEIRCGRAL